MERERDQDVVGEKGKEIRMKKEREDRGKGKKFRM